jgi:hypothetical protein
MTGEHSAHAVAGAPRRQAALLAMGSAIGVAALILALHVVKPELDPSWRFLSEYALGANGWIMSLAFLTWALGCVALFVALKGETATRAATTGRYLLLVVVVALVFAGLFAQDPVTAHPDEFTAHGQIHALASMVGIPGVPLAAMLITVGLEPGRRRGITGLAHLTWISLALMAGYLAWAVPHAGGFEPGVWAGWMNRLVVVTYLAWQFALARRLARDPTG